MIIENCKKIVNRIQYCMNMHLMINDSYAWMMREMIKREYINMYLYPKKMRIICNEVIKMYICTFKVRNKNKFE